MNKYQKELDKLFKKNKWSYWPPLAMLARLLEESGELARLFNHLYGPKPKKASESKQDIEEEIGDILYTLICIANSQKVNLDKAIERSLSKAAQRDKNRFK
ncbi:MAG: nucleotide pyrophosphohydrolase [Patescibacteria group bacterium]